MADDNAAVLARLARAQAQMRARLEKGWERACQEVGERAQSSHRYRSRTGATEASTKGGLLPSSDPNRIVGAITVGTPYAKYLETTTKSGGAAVGEGRYIREEYAFLTPAMTEMQGKLLDIVAEEAKR